MSHQRFPSIDPAKEPHSVSLKVLRLSRPSLVPQHPLVAPARPSPAPVAANHDTRDTPLPASLAYADAPSNPHPFTLTPILNLPPSFGSAYVGETFSCTLCANHDAADAPGPPKFTRDVRIEAEMKTPGSSAVQKLTLGPAPADPASLDPLAGTDLDPGRTLQRIVNFDLKEEGNHVLAVTVSYYEATDTSGKARTFRKLYQFICKGSLIVRTKVSLLPGSEGQRRRWVMEAQLENCSDDVMQLESVGLDLEPGLAYTDCNWDTSASQKPVLHPADVEQCCFVVEETADAATPLPSEDRDGRLVFGVLGIGWRTEMGNKGFLTTGKLGARVAR